MLELEEDVDYTSLADLRGKTVTLTDIKIYQCSGCGPVSRYIELPRWGSLHSELEACTGLRVKHLWCRFNGTEWAIAFKPLKDTPQPRRKRRKHGP
jgi:hypothetical protein